MLNRRLFITCSLFYYLNYFLDKCWYNKTFLWFTRRCTNLVVFTFIHVPKYLPRKCLHENVTACHSNPVVYRIGKCIFRAVISWGVKFVDCFLYFVCVMFVNIGRNEFTLFLFVIIAGNSIRMLSSFILFGLLQGFCFGKWLLRYF